MFNPASFKVLDFNCRHRRRKRIRAAVLSSRKRPHNWSVRHPEPRLDVALAELNSHSHSFVGAARLLASRQPCFG